MAVLPVENLTGKGAPLDAIRESLIEQLRRRGIAVLSDTDLEATLARHRVRYTAGVEAGFARAIRAETGVTGILIPSLEAFETGFPPRVALFARVVSTGEAPALRWMDSKVLAGDDKPGLLDMGLVYDAGELLVRVSETLAASFARHVSRVPPRPVDEPADRRFAPRLVYRSASLDPAGAHSVAVVPFFNRSDRKYAGQIVALHMMRNLMVCQELEQLEPLPVRPDRSRARVARPCAGLTVVEPGLVRAELLRYRIIMTDGVSLPQTDTILSAVGADLVLGGEVLRYEDPRGAFGAPRVDFSVLFIERATRRVVYSAYSDNTGFDGVYFFDLGRMGTAHAMASEMARALGQRMLFGPPTPAR